ncbi:MAG: hypothetical protein AAF483_22260 [Planctomycetota bacterium]
MAIAEIDADGGVYMGIQPQLQADAKRRNLRLSRSWTTRNRLETVSAAGG